MTKNLSRRAAAGAWLSRVRYWLKVRITPSERERVLLYLARLSKRSRSPVVVKVGAHDGVTADPCGEIFLRDDNWRGLLIEPVPHCFERLRSVYGDSDRFTLLQLAIGTSPGRASFYYVSTRAREQIPDLPPWHDQLGSFDRAHIVKHLDGVLEPFIVRTQVRVRTLSDVLAEHDVRHVDLLQIDVEGHDLEVLRSLDFSAIAPRAILVEHRHLADSERRATRSLLASHGYTVRNCGADFFARRR